MADIQEVKKEDSSTEITSVENFENIGGLGFEETTTSDLAVPFLRILEALSPQVNKREAVYIDGAEPGMILNSVSQQVFDGEQGITVIPCYYNRRQLEWRPRDQGGGFVGSHRPDDPIVQTAQRNPNSSSDMLPNGNVLSNTAQFFVLLLTEEGYEKCLITMTSTQLKKARRWLTQMQALTAKGANGTFTLPMMSHRYQLRTIPESNDKGNWFGWEVKKVGPLNLSDESDKELFDIAVEFAKSVKAGEVKVTERSNSSENTPEPDEDDDAPF